MSTATPQLPTVFMVLAEAALSAGGHHPKMHEELADVASFVLPILTVGNLVGRDRDVLSAVLEYGNAPRGGAETSTRAEILAKLRDLATGDSSDFAVRDAAFAIQCHAANDGLRVGLVAGFLLAQMVTGWDGAR